MKIQVKLFATLRLNLGISSIEIETDNSITIMEVLELVSTKLDNDIIPELIEDRKIKVGTIILINGKDVLHAQKLKTMITEDCEISIFPPVGGG